MSRYYKVIYVLLGVVFSFLSIQPVLANKLDINLRTMSLNKQVTTKGKGLFDSFCAGCHQKDLSGGAGFNLKDGEWVHGSQPSDILHNLQNGFDKAGMPGFANAISTADQQAIVAYVLSKREGFDNLTYKIYQLDNAKDYQIEEADIVKSGALKNNFADFELPEIEHYMIEFSGDLYAPKNQISNLYAEKIKKVRIDVTVDGEKIKPKKRGNVQRWLLKKGKQTVNFRFFSHKASKGIRNVGLYVSNKSGSVKLFPVSTRARKDSQDSSFNITATHQHIVQQKKIVDLPAYSVAVGAPEKINYAFNVRSCAINGLWQGELLNIGPNIGGRGKDGSIALGDWLFHSPSQLQPQLAENQACQFIKYRIDGAPVFHFSINNLTLAVVADTRQKNQITFNYQVLNNPEKYSYLPFVLPSNEKIKVSSTAGDISSDTLRIDIKKQTQFSINVAW